MIFFLIIAPYHLNYITVNYKTGDHIQIESDKELINQVKEMFTICLVEWFLKVPTFSAFNKCLSFTREGPQYNGVMTAITNQDNKIFRQESPVQTLNYDPSDNQDGSWTDFNSEPLEKK